MNTEQYAAGHKCDRKLNVDYGVRVIFQFANNTASCEMHRKKKWYQKENGRSWSHLSEKKTNGNRFAVKEIDIGDKLCEEPMGQHLIQLIIIYQSIDYLLLYPTIQVK